MKRTRRFPQRLVRWTSLCVCFVLVLTSFVLFPSQVSIGKNKRSSNPSANSGAQGNGQGRRVAARPPQPGPPAGKLPNLDEMRLATDNARRHGARKVHAPQPVPSTQRRWWYVQPANRAAAPVAERPTTALHPAVKANHSRGNSSAMRVGSAPEPQGGSDMAMARIDPYNRTGTGGVDLLSQNFNWSLGLVGLKGRGLDFGLSLSYNSLSMWTRSGSDVAYNMDQDSPAPGFRLGFPVVQGPYDHSQASTLFYIMITPAGQHVELRRVGTSDVYEAVDTSFSQLTKHGSGNSTYFTYLAQGAQLTFEHNPDYAEYHCTEVKDRNGNYISVSYDSSTGNISTVTDTLGRVVTIHYDSYHNIQSITQPWGSATHTWASFSWTTTPIGSGIFSGTNYTGPARGSSSISVLEWVGLADGSRYYFDYDGSYGMVTKIRYHAWDGLTNGQPGHERRQVTYAYDTTNGQVPRVNSEKDWAENWNGDSNGVPATDGSEEVTTSFSQSSGVGTMTLPDDTVYKEFYGTGYQSGLVTMTKNYATTSAASSDSWKKETTTTWTQDNTGVSYLTNPRVTETNIYDIEGNRKRTTIDYGSTNLGYVQYSLPYLVEEYGADGSTVLRMTYSDYNLSQQYLDQRIIGLVSAVHVSDTQQWQSKTTYDYDNTTIDSQAGSTTHHDSAYSTSTVRGNVTKVWSWDVTDITNSSKAIRRAQITYDTAGSVMSNTDALDHPNAIAYSSNYYYAYPTTMSDAASNSSTVQYDFDTGAVTQTQGPPPSGQSAAMAQTMSYDSVGRLQWITRSDNFWKYIAYADRGDAVMSQVSLTADPDSAWSITVVDGAGRTRLVGHDLPNSTGGYAGAFTLYDNMGRVSQQSNVEETNAYWAPAGDDSGDWAYTQQTYDWKGRPLRTTNPDTTYKEASYGGCGCAGGEVVTLTDEVGRRQKVYSDSLGRQWKTEVLNTNSSVYSTTTNTLDALDHVTQIRQTDNGTSAYQDTTMGYDGYGRLHTKHVPEQSSGTATTYTYNDDDTVNSVTDARGASATYSYNNRRLVTGISYYAPSGITATPDVSYEYDAAGNRTSMTDGFGSKSYTYNSLSQLTYESRTLTNVGTFALSYTYNLGGELTKLTDSTNMSINYAYDSTGRLSGVTGSDTLYASVSTYASDIAYRAWGGLKAMTDGTNHVSSLLYNSKLQPTHFEVSGSVVSQNYDYNNDGRISYVHNTTDVNFDRSYSYDHSARLTTATTGGTARGDSAATPYHETLGYDALSNLTSRYTSSWSQDEFSDGATYTNNRRDGWGYDADGRNTTIDTRSYTFDAAGQTTLMTGQRWAINHYVSTSQASGYDGDGAKIKDTTSGVTTYYLTSSVMSGAIVEELSSSGQKNVGYVYSAGGDLLARQSSGDVAWSHTTPAGTGKYEILTNNTVARTEFDPLGADVGLNAPPTPDTNGGEGDLGGRHTGGIMDSRYSDMFNLSGGCTIDGMAASCSQATALLNSGAAAQCPNNDCGLKGIYDNLLHEFAGIARWDPNAQSAGLGVGGANGYLPMGINFVGGSSVITGWGSSPLIQAVSGIHFISNDPYNDDDVRPVLNRARTQNPSPTAPAQPLPRNYKPPKDPEDPCIKRIGAVTNDLSKIARMVHGRIRSSDFDTNHRHRFPGVEINPRGQSFGTAMSRLTSNGFVTASVLGIQSLDHPEGENFQKQFSDGLWYHVTVDFPTGTDSSTADPHRPTPLVTAHCHATDPTGLAHILDSVP